MRVRSGERGHYNCGPILYFVFLHKRHQTRVFQVEGELRSLRVRCAAGTVVDSSVAHSVNFDFYLIAQSGIQGTSRHMRNASQLDDNEKFTYRPRYVYEEIYRILIYVYGNGTC